MILKIYGSISDDGGLTYTGAVSIIWEISNFLYFTLNLVQRLLEYILDYGSRIFNYLKLAVILIHRVCKTKTKLFLL